MTLPEYLTVIPENIPEELKGLKLWVVWKPEVEKGKSKPGKVPYSLQINKATDEKEVKRASVNDPETWMTFEDAMALYKSSKKYKGISIALSSEIMEEELPRLIGIDLDNCILPDGSIEPEKLEEVNLFNTYVELSPSGKGLRAFCYGYFPAGEGVHAGNNEIYQYRKFLSVTGHKLNGVPTTVENAQEAITAFRAKYFKHLSEIDEVNLPVTSVKLLDEEILSNLQTYKLSYKFKNLFYNGAAEGDDHSQKDVELCSLIVFWTQDKEQIDRIFRQSKLYRRKWDEIHGHDDKGPLTYGQMTINYALKTRKDVYSPKSTNAPLNQSEFSFTMYPFSVSEDGISKVFFKNDSDEGPETSVVQISNTPCIITAIGENIDSGEILYKVKIMDIRHREKILWKKTSDLMKKADVLKLLNEGMHFKEARANDIIDYFDKYINLHKENLPSEFAASAGG